MKYFVAIVLMLMLAGNALAASTSAVKYLDKPAEWYRSDEAKKIAANILSYQSTAGGWPKNVDTAAEPYTGDRGKLEPTYDNKATTDELRFLAHMASATQDATYADAFVRGLGYILKGQYPNGGWPQSYPPDHQYHRYITFNDGAMARLMFFLKEVAHDDLYSFVDKSWRDQCQLAFDRGVDCILKCQIKVDGKLTAWCAQHDEKDFSPQPARAFELMSLSGAESVGVVHVLMSIDNPSPEVIQAVDAAVAWFDAAKIKGIKVEDRPNPSKTGGKKFDRVVVEDPSAPPIWARFYEIGTNKAIFSDRDSVKKYSLAEIGEERRNGYRWYGYWPADLIATQYPAWKAKHSAAAHAATQAANH